MPERNTTGAEKMNNFVVSSSNVKSILIKRKSAPVSPAKCPMCGRVILRLGKINQCTNEYCGYRENAF